MRLPTADIAVAINEAVREIDEWFADPDDLDRIDRAVDTIRQESDPITAAARLAFRVVHTQAFGEGNKRTALLLARWMLDHNGQDGAKILPTDDQPLADLLVRAASGIDVEAAIVELLIGRR